MEPIKFEFVKKCTRGQPVARLVPTDVTGIRRRTICRTPSGRRATLDAISGSLALRINTRSPHVGIGFAGAIDMVRRVMGTAIGSRVKRG